MLKNIYEMISGQISLKQNDYVERMFLQNSRDLVRLLVHFNMVHFHPQLQGCPYSQALMAEQQLFEPAAAGQQSSNNSNNSGNKLARKISQWQKQRLSRVQNVIDEYNLKGWNQ